MSCSKWAYEPEKCDGDYCPGDCDYCEKSAGDIDPRIQFMEWLFGKDMEKKGD